MENFTRASGEEEYGLLMFNRDVDTLGLLLAAQGAAPVGWESRFPRALFTDAKVVEGMRWIRKMQEVKALFPLAGGSWKQALELLADGKIAMWIAPAGEEISGFFGNQEPSFPTGISALPQFAALDESADRGRMAMFYIHANTDDMQACYRLGLYLMQHPQGLPGIPMLESLTATEDPSLMVPSPLASRDDDRRLLSRPLRGWLYDAASTDDLNEGLAQAQWKADLYRACLEQANQPDLALVVQNCQREVDSR